MACYFSWGQDIDISWEQGSLTGQHGSFSYRFKSGFTSTVGIQYLIREQIEPVSLNLVVTTIHGSRLIARDRLFMAYGALGYTFPIVSSEDIAVRLLAGTAYTDIKNERRVSGSSAMELGEHELVSVVFRSVMIFRIINRGGVTIGYFRTQNTRLSADGLSIGIHFLLD